MKPTITDAIVLVLAALISLLTISAVIARREDSPRSSRRALANSLASLAACAVALLGTIQPVWREQPWWGYIPIVAVFITLFLFLYLERAALQIQSSPWIATAIWLAWVGLSLLLYPGPFGIHSLLKRVLSESLAVVLPKIVVFVPWWILLAQAALDIARTNQQPANPIIRKKAQLWFIAWAFIVGGNFLLLNESLAWGLLVTSLAGGGAGVIALARDLPYPRFLAREVISYLLLFTPILALAWVGFELMQRLEPATPGYSTLIVGGALTLLWVGTFRLLARFTPRLVDRLIPATRYDATKLLREYSLNVSNTTAPNMLASISINLLCQAIDLKYAHLFEVIPEASPEKNRYRIQDAGGLGKDGAPALVIDAESILTTFFRSSRRPLFVNQVNTNPLLREAAPEEIVWFTNPNIEVFVPVNTKNEWVGLFALGQKASGAPYTDDDLTLITALSDQISLALQNARLVESLMRVNNDYRRAYAAMEQSNRQLQQAFSQLERIDRTKSDFISVSSHELRTPMTVMRGYNEMLLEDSTIKASPYHFKLVKGIQSGMERMQEVVESMLDVASIDTRALQLHKETISLNYVVHDVVDRLQKALEERKISLKVENLRELPSIEADRDNLQKVFMHVITNAIKFTPDDGSITISALVLAEGVYGFKEGGVEVIVSDTGIGIARANLDLVFKKFYQTGPISLHSSGKIKFKGAGPGLGLAIAKGIVEAHAGKIWAESAGHDEATCPGSQFHIALPLRSV